jgi:hypothetical protein
MGWSTGGSLRRAIANGKNLGAMLVYSIAGINNLTRRLPSILPPKCCQIRFVTSVHARSSRVGAVNIKDDPRERRFKSTNGTSSPRQNFESRDFHLPCSDISPGIPSTMAERDQSVAKAFP